MEKRIFRRTVSGEAIAAKATLVADLRSYLREIWEKLPIFHKSHGTICISSSKRSDI
jgi:hypothetical protein